ncbi:carboxy terminal-processing peptidase [Candidatus Litorirhabdus singularis]|uniref:carboxy terminal-processing peptidase n=1 Tax=Candidatus Litorirhabdus singularis TaxID=2518993 RepID=UPI00242FF8DA|nr:carboxy terminal-processing peptidase [Candidatus Litorirhabdus singularis]
MLTLILILSLAGALLSNDSVAAVAYTKEQSTTAIDLVNKLETRHYSKREFDDALASDLFDAYFRGLDPSHLFLLQSDLDEFEPQRLQLDDEFREGNLDTGFKIFNRYQQRLETRLEWVVRELPALVEAMDFEVDESLSLEPEKRAWAKDMSEADERWRLQIKSAVLSLKLADKPQDELASTLIKRYENQQNRVQQYNEQDAFQVYANALTELYDPHTNYLSPRTSENFNINMSLSLEGIGAVLQLQDEYTKVTRVVAAGPADKQGELKPSDRIIGVAQGDDEFQDVIGWRLDEVVDLIRGPKDTTVRLQVIPASSKSTDSRKVITIVRNKVKLEEQSAQKSIVEIPDGDGVRRVGVIDIPAFYIDFEALRQGDENYKSTTRDVKQLLDELVADGVEGIIIDLRNNGGGSLQEANELTGLFIEYGPTVQIRHSSSKVFRDGKRLRSAYYEGPVAVLINRLSASASEIFAGAIQDYQRGIIIGTQSFGKGTVQTLIPLPEGQLKLTESKFYRISGESTQHRGVIPDVEFPSQYDKEQIGESSLDHALNWDKINPVRHRKYHDIPGSLDALKDQYQQRVASDPDFIYLEDSIALAAEARKITTLPLQESARLQLRETQTQKTLDIENKRRIAKGLDPLESLDEDEPEESADASAVSDDSDAVMDAALDAETAPVADDITADELAVNSSEEAESEEDDEDEDEDEDILLREAGNILLDALQIGNKAVASNS